LGGPQAGLGEHIAYVNVFKNQVFPEKKGIYPVYGPILGISWAIPTVEYLGL